MRRRTVQDVNFFSHYFWRKGKNHQQCLKILKDFKEIFEKAPGSRKSPHDYEGGYLDHIMETFWFASYLYQAIRREYLRKYYKNLVFSLEDVYLILFLHDIEKPFKYTKQASATNEDFLEIQRNLATKKGREEFRLNLIDQYRIELTPAQENALKYIEGENDDYTPEKRTMNELAAFCHACDVLSARIFWDKGARNLS